MIDISPNQKLSLDVVIFFVAFEFFFAKMLLLFDIYLHYEYTLFMSFSFPKLLLQSFYVLNQSSCGYTSHINYSFVHLQESCEKASIICPESEVEALGGCGSRTPDQLSAQLTRLGQRLQSEAQRCALAVPCLIFVK